MNKRYQNALMKNADGEMDFEDFQELKKLTKGKIENLEKSLNELAQIGTEIKDLVASALKKGANIDRRYEKSNIEERRMILGSMFSEFLVFDGTQHRNTKINSAITLIYQNINKLRSKKNGRNLYFLDLSQEVIPLGVVQSHKPQAQTLNLLRIEPNMNPFGCFSPAQLPSQNNQYSNPSGHKKKAQSFD